MTAACIPADRLFKLAAALERACLDVPYSPGTSGTLWHDLNEARAIVSTYLIGSIQPLAIEVTPAPAATPGVSA